MNGIRQRGKRKDRQGVREQSPVAVPRKSGAILLLPSSSHRVAVEDLEAVVHQPQDRVTRERQRLPDRLLRYVHIVIAITQESVGD